MTVDEARLAAHEQAMREDSDYRETMTGFDVLRELAKRGIPAATPLPRQPRRRRPARSNRLWILPPYLPTPRVFLLGPKCERAFNVQVLPIADVHPTAAQFHPPGRTLLFYDFFEDVRELVCERIRPDVYADWSDPREWASLTPGTSGSRGSSRPVRRSAESARNPLRRLPAATRSDTRPRCR